MKSLVQFQVRQRHGPLVVKRKTKIVLSPNMRRQSAQDIIPQVLEGSFVNLKTLLLPESSVYV